jgi:hypothetical protein
MIHKQKYILLGYRNKRIGTYKTKLKPLGYVVGSLGFLSLGIAIIPNGLGFIFYPLGFFLLSLIGVNLSYKTKLYNKIRKMRYKIGLL